jgi:two-component system, sensor histidine kinase
MLIDPGVYRSASRPFSAAMTQGEHPRSIGWFSTSAFAMAGAVQSIFLIGALLVGEDGIPGQGTAAIPLLIAGLLLSWAAAPGWTELVLMWPKRVGGIAAAASEAFRPYSPVLSALVGTCYWWGWVPVSGLTVVLSSSAIHDWFLPNLSVRVLASIIIFGCVALTFCGIKWVGRFAVPFALGIAVLGFLATIIPVVSGHVDWHRATNLHLTTPFHGIFGSVTSMMAGLYLIGYAAPAFEAAACYVGETVDPARNVPRAMLVSAALAGLFFIVLPFILLGTLGPHALSGDLAVELGPVFAPIFGALGKSIAVAFMMFCMIIGTIQPLTGASRTLSQLAEDGVLPGFLAWRFKPTDAPWSATLFTALIEIGLLFIGSPIWFIAAANFTYLISICAPSIIVWLLRRAAPRLERPYRAPNWALNVGLFAACCWIVSAILGFEQFGLPTVILGLVFAYAGVMLYAWRRFEDRTKSKGRGVRRSLYFKLTGAMVIVLGFDGSGYLIAVRSITSGHMAMVTALQDIFVAVAFLAITVGLILPGTIAHAATEVSRAATQLVEGTLKDFTLAVEALGRGDIDAAHVDVNILPVPVLSHDEVGEMAASFNTLQNEIRLAAEGLSYACEGLRAARADLVRAKEDAEAASLAKSQFLAKMSHEIRTPMNGVLSTAELLLASDLTERQRRLATIIQRSGANLLELINEILDHSKLEAGKVRLEQIDFDVCEVIEEAIDMVADRAAEKKLELHAALPQTNSRVNGDPIRLRQVVTNLLSNAVKFTDRGGVWLEAALTNRRAKGVDLRITVRDTGIGISDEYKQRLFETFSQADDATTRKYGGTGLGLAIVKQIVDLSGGDISVESKVGKGTTFSVTLPMVAAQSQGSLRDGSQLAGVHCLVADEAIRSAELVAQLQNWQMLVTTAGDEMSARARLSVEVFPIIIMAAEFSGCDGLRLVQRIRDGGTNRNSAVIVTSAVYAHRDETLVKRLRLSDWLYRPLRQSELYDALLGAVDRSKVVLPPPAEPAHAVAAPQPQPPAMPRAATISNARILLAEDNLVNQEVTSESLGYLGYHADVVDNGASAVAAIRDAAYDLVLMDCHMPEMDGFEATKAVRRIEQADPRRRRTPIIALSANAMQDDKEHCLACGMDDHLAKPFKLEHLQAKLAHWLSANDATAPAETSEDAAAGDAAIDWSALDRIAQLQRPDRPDVVAKVVESFQQTTPPVIDTLSTALEERNFQRLKENAHKLKSSSANVGAVQLSALFRELEGLAAASDGENVQPMLETINREFELVSHRLAEYLRCRKVAG